MTTGILLRFLLKTMYYIVLSLFTSPCQPSATPTTLRMPHPQHSGCHAHDATPTTLRMPHPPSPGLVDPLCYEVSRESRLKALLVLKGVVTVSVGHATALKPAVEHLRDTPQHALTQSGRDGDRVNAATVRGRCCHDN